VPPFAPTILFPERGLFHCSGAEEGGHKATKMPMVEECNGKRDGRFKQAKSDENVIQLHTITITNRNK
jgi:hypothetical protein